MLCRLKPIQTNDIGLLCVFTHATKEKKLKEKKTLKTSHIIFKPFTLIGCVIERNVIIAPGSVLPVDTFVPSGQLWAGNPAKYVRDLTDDEKKKVKKVLTAYSKITS